MKTWKHGQRAQLAKLAGCSRQFLYDILSRRSRAPVDLARQLETASRLIGVFIPRYDFMESDTTNNPLFKAKEPEKE